MSKNKKETIIETISEIPPINHFLKNYKTIFKEVDRKYSALSNAEIVSITNTIYTSISAHDLANYLRAVEINNSVLEEIEGRANKFFDSGIGDSK